MSSRKAERSDGDSGGHTVTITRYRCDACGARWEYENDKTNQQAGWSIVGQ
jgi:transposase-like protein